MSQQLSPICLACGKKVYLMEKAPAHDFHLSCFKCSVCGTNIQPSSKNFTIENRKLLCSLHQKGSSFRHSRSISAVDQSPSPNHANFRSQTMTAKEAQDFFSGSALNSAPVKPRSLSGSYKNHARPALLLGQAPQKNKGLRPELPNLHNSLPGRVANPNDNPRKANLQTSSETSKEISSLPQRISNINDSQPSKENLKKLDRPADSLDISGSSLSEWWGSVTKDLESNSETTNLDKNITEKNTTIHSQKSNDNPQKSNDNPQKSNDNSQKSNDNPQKLNDNSQKLNDNLQKSNHNLQKSNDTEKTTTNQAQKSNDDPKRSNNPQKSNDNLQTSNDKLQKSNGGSRKIDDSQTSKKSDNHLQRPADSLDKSGSSLSEWWGSVTKDLESNSETTGSERNAPEKNINTPSEKANHSPEKTWSDKKIGKPHPHKPNLNTSSTSIPRSGPARPKITHLRSHEFLPPEVSEWPLLESNITPTVTPRGNNDDETSSTHSETQHSPVNQQRAKGLPKFAGSSSIPIHPADSGRESVGARSTPVAVPPKKSSPPRATKSGSFSSNWSDSTVSPPDNHPVFYQYYPRHRRNNSATPVPPDDPPSQMGLSYPERTGVIWPHDSDHHAIDFYETVSTTSIDTIEVPEPSLSRRSSISGDNNSEGFSDFDDNLSREVTTPRTQRKLGRPSLTRTESTDLPVTLLKDTYQIVKKIGGGGYATVYSGLHTTQGHTVAIKKFVNVEPSSYKSIQSEIKLLKDLKHPHIVKYIDQYETNDQYFIIMEYVEKSLSQILADTKYLIEDLACLYTRQILEGLKYLHDQSVIHLDIKPGNILVSGTGVVKLADFGISKKFKSKKSTGEYACSPWYSAPEVFDLNFVYESDIWSLGCTVIELLTGSAPYSEIKVFLVETYVKSDHHPEFPKHASEAAHSFLAECFHKEPTRRPSASRLTYHPWVRDVQLNKSVLESRNSAKTSPRIERSTTPSFEKIDSDDEDFEFLEKPVSLAQYSERPQEEDPGFDEEEISNLQQRVSRLSLLGSGYFSQSKQEIIDSERDIFDGLFDQSQQPTTIIEKRRQQQNQKLLLGALTCLRSQDSLKVRRGINDLRDLFKSDKYFKTTMINNGAYILLLRLMYSHECTIREYTISLINELCEDIEILTHLTYLGFPKMAMKYISNGESTRERIDCGKLILTLLKPETFSMLVAFGGLSAIVQMVGYYDKSLELSKLGIEGIHILMNKEESIDNRDQTRLRKKEYFGLLLLEGVIKKLCGCFREFVTRRNTQKDTSITTYSSKLASILFYFSTLGDTFKERFCSKAVIRHLVAAMPYMNESEANLICQSLARVSPSTTSPSQMQSLAPAMSSILDLTITSIKRKTNLINGTVNPTITFLLPLLRRTTPELDRYVLPRQEMAVEHGVLELIRYLFERSRKSKGKASSINVIGMSGFPLLFNLCHGTPKAKDHLIKSDVLNFLITLAKDEPFFLKDILESIVSLTSHRPDLYEREGAEQRIINPILSLFDFSTEDVEGKGRRVPDGRERVASIVRQLRALARFLQISKAISKTFLNSSKYSAFKALHAHTQASVKSEWLETAYAIIYYFDCKEFIPIFQKMAEDEDNSLYMRQKASLILSQIK